MRPHDLAAHVIGELTRRHRDVGWSIVDDVGWSIVDDVVLGCADQVDEANGNVAWMSALLAGLPGGSRDHDQPCAPPASTLGYGFRFCRRT
jgi:acetyl-CoA acetyltransferase